MTESSILLYENKNARASGRSWKDIPNLKSKLKKRVTGKKRSFEERMKEKEEIKRIRNIEKAEKEERIKQRREASERKKQRNMAKINKEILSSGVQVITRTEKIKNWNKKARRMLRKVSLESLNL